MEKFEKTQVRSAVAMRVVNLDRQRFNEAVANNYYECAPSTVAGSVRLFKEDDLVALFVFARLLELNVLPRRAGQLACELKSSLRDRNHNPSLNVVYVRGTTAGFFIDASAYNPNHEADENKEYPAAGAIFLSMHFNISTIRRLIRERLEYERSILGIEGSDD
jgi:hypothetical protein